VTVFLCSLEGINICVVISVYVVHFNLQISSTSPNNLFCKYVTVLLQYKIMGFHIW